MESPNHRLWFTALQTQHFNELQDEYPWLLESDVTLTTYEDTDPSHPRPVIKLSQVNLGSRLWQINGLDVHILNSNLMNLKLKCTDSLSPMKIGEDPRNLSNVEIVNSSVLLLQTESVNVMLRQSAVQNMTIRGDLNGFDNVHRNGENLTLAEVVNSTVQYFHGQRIHMEMSKCFITVKTHPPLSPMFVTEHSTAKITNCIFHGDKNPPALLARGLLPKERCLPFKDIQNMTSVLFVFQSSRITIRQSSFEAIHVNMSYDKFTSCIHAVGSQIRMINTKVKDNYGYSIINAYETLMTVSDSKFIRNVPSNSVIIGRHAQKILLNGAILEGNNACNGTLHIVNSTINVENTIFRNNTAVNGGSIYAGWSSTVTVENTTFTNNSAGPSVNDYYHGNGGAVYAIYKSTVTVGTTTFTNNSAQWGGAVYAVWSTVTVEHTTFTNNSAVRWWGSANSYGGAVYAVSSTVTVENSTFTNNSGPSDGGAVFAYRSSRVTVESTTFTNNSARRGGGGAVYAESSTVSVENSTFTSNSAGGWGGAVSAEYSSTVTVESTTFTNNSAAHGGGAVYAVWSTVTVEYSTFTSNSARSSLDHIISYGGAVYASSNTVSVKNATFTSNIADWGGAVYAEDDNTVAIVTVENTTFTENTASKGPGGAIHVIGCLNITMNRITFKQNNAKDKGGALFAQNTKVIIMINTLFSVNSGISGGAIYGEDINDMTVKDSAFINNTVDTGNYKVDLRNGGALYTGGSGAVILSNVTFTGNQGIYRGGAVYAGQQVQVTVKNSLYYGNEVDHGGAIFLEGDTNLSVTSTRLISNHANEDGGAIYLTGNAALTAEYVNLSSNSANDDRGRGGALYAGGTSSARLYDSRFQKNVCNLEGGAIYGEDNAKIVLQNTILTENVCNFEGGAIYAEDNAEIVLENTILTENNASKPYIIGRNTCGGAMSGSGNSTIHLSGTILLKNRATKGGSICGKDKVKLNITNTTFQNNNAQNVGGAIHVSDQSLITINKALFADNAAQHNVGLLDCRYRPPYNYFRGGAVYAEDNANIHITHTKFINNAAQYYYYCWYPNQSLPQSILDDSLHADGGAIFVSSQGNIVINDTRFSNNQAKRNGGSISVNGTAEIILTNTHFTNNSGGSKGAAVYAQESNNVYFHGSDFSNNIAITDAALYMSNIETMHTVNCMLHCTSKKPCLYLNGHDEYLHSHTRLVSQNTILSSFSKNFMEQAEERGLIVIDETSNVTEKESVYASGKDTCFYAF